jgi:hypothetical protein
VKVSFFGLPNLPRLSPPPVAKDNGLAVASLLDLAGTKASVVQMRAEAKDYILSIIGKCESTVANPMSSSAQQNNPVGRSWGGSWPHWRRWPAAVGISCSGT